MVQGVINRLGIIWGIWGVVPRHHTRVLVGMVRDHGSQNLVGSGKGWL